MWRVTFTSFDIAFVFLIAGERTKGRVLEKCRRWHDRS
jgi:hypothetical protein